MESIAIVELSLHLLLLLSLLLLRCATLRGRGLLLLLQLLDLDSLLNDLELILEDVVLVRNVDAQLLREISEEGHLVEVVFQRFQVFLRLGELVTEAGSRHVLDPGVQLRWLKAERLWQWNVDHASCELLVGEQVFDLEIDLLLILEKHV